MGRINKQYQATPDTRVTQLCTTDPMQKLQNYISKLVPANNYQKIDWSKSLLEESPVLLPNLKFHDLVFGHSLGQGAFSEVKYAKLISRDGKPRSYWQEFAVKVISIKTIQELNYAKAVSREITILNTLSHPNIA